MLTISQPLSAVQAQRYHAEEFSNARVNYYTTEQQVRGTWHGQLADHFGLSGEVDEARFQRLAEGQHPLTGEAFVRHQTACRYTTATGKTITAMEHRAGWDATFSAPKSVSLTALVGGDARVREAHQAAVAAALHELEPFAQARLGGNLTPEATGNWVAATFEHDSARPVRGYAAPQLHTHVVVFNLTHTADGEIRPLQPRELYRSQSFATAVYRSALATRLRDLGYAIEHGASGQPEIRGYTAAYLEASSPRRQQIEAHLEAHQQHGAVGAQIAAHRTREPKTEHSREEMHRQHRALAEAFGDQPAHVVQAAHQQAARLERGLPRIPAGLAVAYAESRAFEREAVADERQLLRDALKVSMGEVSLREIRAEVQRRLDAGEFIAVRVAPGTPGRAFTTREMLTLERETIQLMRDGQAIGAPMRDISLRQLAHAYPRLSQEQHAAVGQVLSSRDRLLALEGVAGAGKTTALAALRVEAERAGYVVEGFAPTSRAAQLLADAGMPSSTLQGHLERHATAAPDQRHLYVVDESSLASTRQVHTFLARLGPHDRVLFVGDVRQHQGVEAGRPYQQLQEAGLQTARLDTILRQRDPALKAVVEDLARGHVGRAMQQLDRQARVHEITDRSDRMRAVAHDYVRHPGSTLVVAPDNQSRLDLNAAIHRARQEAGQVPWRERSVRVLVARQDVTGADRQWAQHYAVGDVLRYSKGSRVHGLAAGEYARVAQVRIEENLLTVRRETGERVTYDPRRVSGVALYRDAARAFAVGDRLQFTAPHRARHLANRELGTLEQIDRQGRLQLRLDSGRTIRFRLQEHPHLDYGYAMTSHSSQGQTADRVLVQIDTAQAAEALVNSRLAYVAISRARSDVQIYTNDKAQLGEMLQREVSHRTALEASQGAPAIAPTTNANQRRRRGPEHAVGLGL